MSNNQVLLPAPDDQLQLQKLVFIFKMIIMSKKILNTKITEKISSEESINLQELVCITKRSSGKMGNVASRSDDLILRLIDKIYMRPGPALGTFFGHATLLA